MSERLPPAPEPDDLPDPRDEEWLTLPAGSVWARLYFHAGRYPVRWNEFRTVELAAPSRFDPFGAPGLDGVLYAAGPVSGDADGDDSGSLQPGAHSSLATCVAEAAQDTRILDRLGQRTFVVAELTLDLRLLDLSTDWATRAGAGTHLSTAPRRETARWARAIATRWPDLHGVAYVPSTRPAGRALALWRCRPEIDKSKLLMARTLDDPVLHRALSWAARATGTTLLRDILG